MSESKTFGYRSLFWPIILIGIGLVWLLSNMELLPSLSIRVLFRLWPLLLIAIGLDIIIGRRSPVIGALIGVGTVVLVLVLAYTAPNLLQGSDAVTETFTTEVGTATSAEVNLNLSVGDTTLTALSDAATLIDAELTHVGEIDFEVRGDQHKVVEMRQVGDPIDSVDVFGFLDFFDESQLKWDIGLSPDLPIELNIDGSVGKANLDLTGINLESLDISGAVGDVNLTLPATGSTYSARLDGGVGIFDITITQGASVTLLISGGVGDVSVSVPASAAVRVDANTGVGNVSVPSRFTRLSGGDEFIGDSGVWETPDFNQAEQQIVIEFDGGVGDFRVR